jgi:hypothetical protein
MTTPAETTVDIEALAREIAIRLDPLALWDSKDVAAALRCDPRYVTERYANVPGFPKAIRLPSPSGKLGHPRWRRIAIQNWVASLEAGRKPAGGRPRKQVEFTE